MNTVRQPVVAGLFYPAKASELARVVEDYLAAATPVALSGPVKAIIVPNAGYLYSGATAAAAYATLPPQSDQIRRVVLLGTAHRTTINGLALIGVQYFRTPLGDIEQDQAAFNTCLKLPFAHCLDTVHWREHSLEVQLPFLQSTLKRFSILPLLVGRATTEDIAIALNAVWGDDETLLVVSSDLSRPKDYRSAQYQDGGTAQAIDALGITAIDQQRASYCPAARGLLRVAAQRQLLATTMAATSGASNQQPSLGYGSWVFTVPVDS